MTQSCVLVVDDEAPVRRALERALDLEGYVVEQASDGVEALECIDRALPDLVVLECPDAERRRPRGLSTSA